MSGAEQAARELRLALAMRGGVSLSVWIGGSCAEIDSLRTADPHGDGFWDRLLGTSGYSSVVVDILAGASAGGLNGVVYAASQQYGFSLDGLRDIWVEVGDTRELLRRRRQSGSYWPSFFCGDGYFFPKAEDALRALHATVSDGKRSAPTRRSPVMLSLSATLVEPVRRAVRSPEDEPLSNDRFATGFTFRHPHFGWQRSDFPAVEASDPRPSVWSRLALAARSTSSFPVAFEAAWVRSVRRRSFTSEVVDPGNGLGVDMAGVFQDRGNRDAASEGFLVSDGGILDNIPLARALQAIADAPADGPTDRSR